MLRVCATTCLRSSTCSQATASGLLLRHLSQPLVRANSFGPLSLSLFPSAAKKCSFRQFSTTPPPGPVSSTGYSHDNEDTWLDRVKAAGTGKCPPRVAFEDILTSGAVSFAGMSTLSVLHFGLTGGSDLTMILGSMGASAVLVYAAPALPLAQPRNVIGGHLVSAFVGVTTYSLLGSQMWLAVPVAASGAIMGMLATRTLHPPAGGTVLIALMGSTKIQAMGYALLCPVTLTSSMIVLTGVALNNLFKSGGRRYPTYWW